MYRYVACVQRGVHVTGVAYVDLLLLLFSPLVVLFVVVFFSFLSSFLQVITEADLVPSTLYIDPSS